MAITTAQLAAYLIHTFEGMRTVAYWDPHGKVWTCGFGHVSGVVEGTTCTIEEAIVWLAQDSAPLLEMVKDRPVVEAAALVSFGYNCGAGALRRVLSGDVQIVHEEFMTGAGTGAAYGESSGGAVLPGLVARRNLEAALVEASRAGAGAGGPVL